MKRVFQVSVTSSFLQILLAFSALISPQLSYGYSEVNKTVKVDEQETQLVKRFSERAVDEDLFEYSISAGYRYDSLGWSIAIDDVDVASEVKWDNLIISQIKFAGRVVISDGWFVSGSYATGAVNSGEAEDSDYAGAGRTQLFSHMSSQAGGSVNDASFSFGKQVDVILGHVKSIELLPQFGGSLNQQRLTMTEGYQTLPFSASLSQLDNNYDANWIGLWVGGDAHFKINDEIELAGAFQYHQVRYHASANWNLRSDLGHPISFKHHADGRGIIFSAGVKYAIDHALSVGFVFDYQDWITESGTDDTFFSTGLAESYTLNPVEWRSNTYSFLVSYQF